MKKWLIIVLLLVVGCGITSKTVHEPEDLFKTGLREMNTVDIMHNISIDKPPAEIQAINNALADFYNLKNKYNALEPSGDVAALLDLVNFRIWDLEANREFRLATSFGNKGTVKNGFACSMKPYVISAAAHLQVCGIKGFKAVDYLKALFDTYPEKADLLEVRSSFPVFLNASYHNLYRQGLSEERVINYFCKEDVNVSETDPFMDLMVS